MGVHKRGNIWYIDYYFEGRRIRESVGPNKRMAETALAKRKTQIAEGKFLETVTQSKHTFDQLSSEYMKWAKANKLSWERDQRSIRLLAQKFGGMKLTKITPLLIEKYKRERIKKVKGATINRELACLKGMFTKAIAWDMATSNPVKKVKLFREDNGRNRFLELEEIAKLLSSCHESIKPLIIAALNTGMRYSELTSLKWCDVDLRRKMIRVCKSKNGHSRDVPITKQLLDTLKELDRRSDYVFCRADGSKVNSIRTAFTKAIRRAGINDFTFHDLRHTFASHLVMNGSDLLTVKDLLGHRTLNMALRYSHLSPEHKKSAMKTLQFPDGHNMVTRPKVARRSAT